MYNDRFNGGNTAGFPPSESGVPVHVSEERSLDAVSRRITLPIGVVVKIAARSASRKAISLFKFSDSKSVSVAIGESGLNEAHVPAPVFVLTDTAPYWTPAAPKYSGELWAVLAFGSPGDTSTVVVTEYI